MTLRVTLLLTLLAGCEDPYEAQCALAETVSPSVTIGAGEDAFETIDGPLSSVFGSQGGSHVWVALQTEGLAPGTRREVAIPDLLGGLYQGDNEVGAISGLYQPLRGDAAEGWVAGLELRLFEEYWYDEQLASEVGFDVEGPLTIEIELTDACGNEASSGADVELDR